MANYLTNLARHAPTHDNEGSLARDLLANERTFLAWVRTALGVIGLGVLLGKLVETDGLIAEVIGLAMVGFGAAMLVYSAVRYQQVNEQLAARKIRPAHIGPLLLAAVGILIAIGAVILLVF